MEELKMIVEMIAKLPQAALWVLIGFWAYKVIVVGSIYGLIRFTVDKLHHFLVQRKVAPPEIKQVEIRAMIDGMCIGGQVEPLIAQIHRVRGRGLNIKSEYIHSQGVSWLREAIDAKIELEAANGKAKA